MIDPHSVAAVVGLVNSAFSSVKTASELAKKTSDRDLKSEIGSAFDNVLELKVKVYELAEENRSLREQLAQRDSIKRESKHGFWLKEGETHPLCPRCYEGSEHLVVYLSAAKFSQGFGYRRTCNVCGTAFDSNQLVHDSDFAQS